MGSEIVVCSATARTKSALGVILLISAFQGIILLIPGYHPPHSRVSSSSLGIILLIFAASFFKALDTRFSWEANERASTVSYCTLSRRHIYKM